MHSDVGVLLRSDTAVADFVSGGAWATSCMLSTATTSPTTTTTPTTKPTTTTTLTSTPTTTATTSATTTALSANYECATVVGIEHLALPNAKLCETMPGEMKVLLDTCEGRSGITPGEVDCADFFSTQLVVATSEGTCAKTAEVCGSTSCARLLGSLCSFVWLRVCNSLVLLLSC